MLNFMKLVGQFLNKHKDIDLAKVGLYSDLHAIVNLKYAVCKLVGQVDFVNNESLTLYTTFSMPICTCSSFRMINIREFQFYSPATGCLMLET